MTCTLVATLFIPPKCNHHTLMQYNKAASLTHTHSSIIRPSMSQYISKCQFHQTPMPMPIHHPPSIIPIPIPIPAQAQAQGKKQDRPISHPQPAPLPSPSPSDPMQGQGKVGYNVFSQANPRTSAAGGSNLLAQPSVRRLFGRRGWRKRIDNGDCGFFFLLWGRFWIPGGSVWADGDEDGWMDGWVGG